MTDLTFVSLDEIWKEICKRYDGAILTTLKTLDGESEEMGINFHGGKPLCVGLAERTKHKILDSMNNEEADDGK